MKAASLFAGICAVTFSLSSTQIALALPDKAIESEDSTVTKSAVKSALVQRAVATKIQ
jgi:hypothetical protein